jgi:hypothetical protein
LKRQIAAAMKAIHRTSVEISGYQENIGLPVINEVARSPMVSGSGLKVSKNKDKTIFGVCVFILLITFLVDEVFRQM